MYLFKQGPFSRLLTKFTTKVTSCFVTSIRTATLYFGTLPFTQDLVSDYNIPQIPSD